LTRVDPSGAFAPFAAIVVTGMAVWLVYPFLFGLFMGAPPAVRILAAAVMIFPVAFFMGMPFPMGLAALESKPRGAIAWAWSMNGLFTTIGGVTTALLSFAVGFRGTLVIAFAAYAVAGAVLVLVKRSNRMPAVVPAEPAVAAVFSRTALARTSMGE
jgi:hypothetical protein